MSTGYIIWNADPVIFWIKSFPVRWYGFLFALGFIIAPHLERFIFKKEGKPIELVDTIVGYILIGTIIGARLGDVIFYHLDYFIYHPLEIFLPITFGPPIQFGFRGLSSHGATIGIITTVMIFCIRHRYHIAFKLRPWKLKFTEKKDFVIRFAWLADRAIIAIALAAASIRMGNFANSEIIGVPTKSNYGIFFSRNVTNTFQSHARAIEDLQFTPSTQQENNTTPYQPITLSLVFKKAVRQEKRIKSFVEYTAPRLLNRENVRQHIHYDPAQPLDYRIEKDAKGRFVAHIETLAIPRHPAQLYEALTYLLLFIIVLGLWFRKKGKVKEGSLIGIFFILGFTARFFLEFYKITQPLFENFQLLNTAHFLSIPAILGGFGFLYYAYTKSPQAREEKDIKNKT